MNYWIAYTQGKNKKYASLFNEIEQAEKFLNNLLSPLHNTFRTIGMGDYYQELEDNFTIKCFSNKSEAEKFRDDFLENRV